MASQFAHLSGVESKTGSPSLFVILKAILKAAPGGTDIPGEVLTSAKGVECS
jgi:hypothetical protein